MAPPGTPVLRLAATGKHRVRTALRALVDQIESGAVPEPECAVFVTLTAAPEGELQVYGMGAAMGDLRTALGMLALGSDHCVRLARG